MMFFRSLLSRCRVTQRSFAGWIPISGHGPEGMELPWFLGIPIDPPMTGPREGLDEGGLRSNSLPWTLDEWLIWDCVEVSICLVINISNQKYGKQEHPTITWCSKQANFIIVKNSYIYIYTYIHICLLLQWPDRIMFSSSLMPDDCRWRCEQVALHVLLDDYRAADLIRILHDKEVPPKGLRLQ